VVSILPSKKTAGVDRRRQAKGRNMKRGKEKGTYVWRTPRPMAIPRGVVQA
jgi:hypothetical protein